MVNILKVPSESFISHGFEIELFDLKCDIVFSKVGVVKARKDFTLFIN